MTMFLARRDEYPEVFSWCRYRNRNELYKDLPRLLTPITLTEEEVNEEVTKANEASKKKAAAESGTDIEDDKFKEIFRDYFLKAKSDYESFYPKYPTLTSEIEEMKRTLKVVERNIRNLSVDDIESDFSGISRDSNNKLSYSEQSLIRAVNELIEDEYDSPNFRDSDIETEFDNYYIRVTGLEGNYF